jgi:hypothetical protein
MSSLQADNGLLERTSGDAVDIFAVTLELIE